MKRNIVIRIFCVMLAVLIGIGTLGGGLYALFSGSEQQEVYKTPLFRWDDQLYLLTDQSTETIEESERVSVTGRIQTNVIPQENGESNFGEIGDCFVYDTDGDLYYESSNGDYYFCIPVTTNLDEAADE